LERVRSPQHERGDPDVHHRERRHRRDDVEAPFEPIRHRASHHEEPDRQRADHEGERGEEEPAGGIVLPGRRPGSDSFGRRWCRDADAEGVDARWRMAVRPGDPPPDRVRLAASQP
jgi:hypothetical protein